MGYGLLASVDGSCAARYEQLYSLPPSDRRNAGGATRGLELTHQPLNQAQGSGTSGQFRGIGDVWVLGDILPPPWQGEPSRPFKWGWRMNDTVHQDVSPETHRSLARCIFARLVHSSPALRITELGVAVLAPVFRYQGLRLDFGPEHVNTSDLEFYTQLRDSLLPPEENVSEALLIERFRTGMIDGHLRDLPKLGPLIESEEGVKRVREQLIRYQLPLIDFLHCMAVMLITQVEKLRLLQRDENGNIRRAI